MNVSEMMIWYRKKLKEGLSGEEIEKELDRITEQEKIDSDND